MSAKVLQIRRGTSVQNSAFVGAEGELIYVQDQMTLYVHDGATPGGWPVQAPIAERLLAWSFASAFQLVNVNRDTNGAITTASIMWPDGGTGLFTTDATDPTFLGAINAWHATYVLNGVSKLVTQAAVTRDALGNITQQPTITVN